MIQKFKNKTTGVVITKNGTYGNSNWFIEGEATIPPWYFKLNPIDDNWEPQPTWEITCIHDICLCGHNGQTINPYQKIHTIIRYPDKVEFSVGDYVTDSVCKDDNRNDIIKRIDIIDGMPIITTDVLNLHIDIFSCEHSKSNKIIDEQIFWSVIDSIGWGNKTTNYKQISANLENIYSVDFLEKLKEFVKYKRIDLQNHLKNYSKRTVNNFGYFTQSDDAFYDLCAHIVGSGKHFYDVVMQYPGGAKDIVAVENFEYIFH